MIKVRWFIRYTKKQFWKLEKNGFTCVLVWFCKVISIQPLGVIRRYVSRTQYRLCICDVKIPALVLFPAPVQLVRLSFCIWCWCKDKTLQTLRTPGPLFYLLSQVTWKRCISNISLHWLIPFSRDLRLQIETRLPLKHVYRVGTTTSDNLCLP